MSKIKQVVYKNKTKLIVAFAIWIVLMLIFVAPVAIGIGDATGVKGFSITLFIESIMKNLTNPFSALGQVFNEKYIGIFGKTLGCFSLGYLIIAMYGLIKSRPKSEYDTIEHGPSDWCEGGEQTSIPTPTQGIILSQKNSLPVHKLVYLNLFAVGRHRLR